MRFAEHRQLLERLALGFPIQEVRRGRNVLVVALFWITLPNGDETFGFFERQGMKQNRINHTENRRVRPDSERERKDGHGGEARGFKQLAKGESQIIHNAVQKTATL